MASDWATCGGISRAVNRRGMTTCFRDESPHQHNAVIGRGMQPLRRMLRANAGDELLHLGQNALDDNVDASGVGMQPVVLQKLQIAGGTVEEERINKHVIFRRKIGIDAFERSPVFGPEIWR